MTCLTNLGHTCFINSIIQCLSHLPEFIVDESIRLNREYMDLWRLMQQGHRCITPSRFVNILYNTLKLDRNQQQDAHELLVMMLDAMNYSSRGTHTTIIEQNGQESRTDTTFLTLEIPITSSTLDECMTHYCAPETVEWNGGQAIKRTEIQMPPLLFITLKRFTSKNKKNTDMVKIPLMYKDYELKAVCNHSGTTNGGHYTATVLLDKWYEFNDESVSVVDSPSTPRAYCLMFRKKAM